MVGKGVPSPLTIEQVICLHLQIVASQGDRRPMSAVVGTHRNLEGKMKECKHEGECIKSREEKNQRLKEMVESFGMEDSIISKTHSEFIFAINAKTPEDRGGPPDSRSFLKKCPHHIIKIHSVTMLTLKGKVVT